MPFTKIEAKDYDGKGVTGLPDIPRLDTLDMQKKFDELAKDVAIPKHNVLVDELSGETAADNLGIADDIADFINPTKKIKPLLVTFAKKIKENSNDRHTHENKTVLDSITDTAIKAWNKVSNLFTNIDGVEDVVSGRTSKIPSSFAISQYVQQMGGGDMVQSIYDRNGNGIVDDAEALGGKAAGEYQTAESQELQTTSKSVVGAVNEVFNKTKDVLNTKEEIEGNTDPTAIAGALSVKELSNDLQNKMSKYYGSATLSEANEKSVLKHLLVDGDLIVKYGNCDFSVIVNSTQFYSGTMHSDGRVTAWGHIQQGNSKNAPGSLYSFYYNRGADPVLKKLGRSGTIAGVGGYWMDPPAGEYKEWTTGCVRWDGDNLLVTVEDDYAQGHLAVGAKVGSKSRPGQWGDKTGGLITLKY